MGFKGANLLCDSQLISIFEATLSVLYSQWYGDEGQGLSFQNCVHAEFGIPRRNYLRRRMNNPTPHQPSIFAACCAVLFVGALLLAGTGCSEYNKIMKRADLDYKYERALGFLDSNKCYGALPLLEEVVSLTRGTERSVDAQYNFAKAHRCVGDYYLARYYFKMFAKTFPNDPRAEEARAVGKSDASRALGASQCYVEESGAQRDNRPDVKGGQTERKNNASQ